MGWRCWSSPLDAKPRRPDLLIDYAQAASPLVRTGSGLMAVAARIRKGLKELKRADGTPYVQLLDAGDTKCLPVVAPRVHVTVSARRRDALLSRRSRRA